MHAEELMNKLKDYPFTTETGDTIMNDQWLVRAIREKCGDAIADYVEKRIGADYLSPEMMVTVEKLARSISQLEHEVEEISALLDDAEDMAKELKDNA